MREGAEGRPHRLPPEAFPARPHPCPGRLDPTLPFSDIKQRTHSKPSFRLSYHRRGAAGVLSQGLPALEMRLSPRDAFFSDREAVSLHSAAGRVSAETLSPYPPVRGGVVLISCFLRGCRRC